MVIIVISSPFRLGKKKTTEKNLSWWSDDDHEAGKKDFFQPTIIPHSSSFPLFFLVFLFFALGVKGDAPANLQTSDETPQTFFFPPSIGGKFQRKFYPLRPSLLSHFGRGLLTFPWRNDMLGKEVLKQKYDFRYCNLLWFPQNFGRIKWKCLRDRDFHVYGPSFPPALKISVSFVTYLKFP